MNVDYDKNVYYNPQIIGSLLWHYWYSGHKFFVVGGYPVHSRCLNSIPNLYPQEVSIPQVMKIKKCFQTLPSVLWKINQTPLRIPFLKQLKKQNKVIANELKTEVKWNNKKYSTQKKEEEEKGTKDRRNKGKTVTTEYYLTI